MKRLTASVVVMMLALGSAASAHDHRPPRATLRLGSEVQQGRPYHADGWAKPSGAGHCQVSFATGFPAFRKPLKYSQGEDIVVRFHKKSIPLELEVQRWPRVDANGHAAGSPTPLPWLLRPHLADDDVAAWDVVVVMPQVEGHLYLGVAASWRDEDGCSSPADAGSQYAAWTFHLVSRRQLVSAT